MYPARALSIKNSVLNCQYCRIPFATYISNGITSGKIDGEGANKRGVNMKTRPMTRSKARQKKLQVTIFFAK